MDEIIKETVGTIIKWGYVALLIILVVMIFWKIVYSGSDILIVGLILANLGYSWHINNQLQRHIGQHEGYQQGMRNRFSKKK